MLLDADEFRTDQFSWWVVFVYVVIFLISNIDFTAMKKLILIINIQLSQY